MLGQSITKNSLILTLFAVVTAAILAVTYSATAERISAAERAAAQAALLELVPRSRHNNDMLSDTLNLSSEMQAALGFHGKQADTPVAYIARFDGKPVAVILPTVAPDGYSGDIKLIVGINLDGTSAGVRALSHKETPGLGDKVDLRKSNWILNFNGRSLLQPSIEQWAVKKDGGTFDQFTGATITPRAVVKSVKKALLFFQQQRDVIFPSSSDDDIL